MKIVCQLTVQEIEWAKGDQDETEVSAWKRMRQVLAFARRGLSEGGPGNNLRLPFALARGISSSESEDILYGNRGGRSNGIEEGLVWVKRWRELKSGQYKTRSRLLEEVWLACERVEKLGDLSFVDKRDADVWKEKAVVERSALTWKGGRRLDILGDGKP